MTILDRPVPLDPKTRAVRMDPRSHPALWTPRQTHIWKSATFTVPVDVSDERVQFAADKYMGRFGDSLEKQEFQVLHMGKPAEDRGVVARGMTPPDRRAYVVWAKVRRRPITITVDVPDEDIPLYEAAGYRHT